MSKDEYSSYDFSFIVTYGIMTENSSLSEKEKEEDRELINWLYKIQLLQFFKLDNKKNEHEDILNKNIKDLRNILKKEAFFNNLIAKIKNENKELKEEIIFSLLFSFDLFYLFHKFLLLNLNEKFRNENNSEKIIKIVEEIKIIIKKISEMDSFKWINYQFNN